MGFRRFRSNCCTHVLKDILKKTIKSNNDIFQSDKWLDAFMEAEERKTVKVKCSDINIDSWLNEHLVHANEQNTLFKK